MRKTFRLRTFLVALVLLALPLAYFGDRWRRCDFEYFRRHAKLAQRYECDAGDARKQLRMCLEMSSRPPYSTYTAPLEAVGPPVPGSTRLIPSPAQLQQEIAHLRRVAKVADQQFRYHRRLAGRAYRDTGYRSL